MLGNDYPELFRDRYVLIIEDIFDTGATYEVITRRIKDFNPIIITYCAFLWKVHDKLEVDIDKENFLYGYTIPNKFVVGYGLDYDGRYRQLKDIYKILRSKTAPFRGADTHRFKK